MHIIRIAIVSHRRSDMTCCKQSGGHVVFINVCNSFNKEIKMLIVFNNLKNFGFQFLFQ